MDILICYLLFASLYRAEFGKNEKGCFYVDLYVRARVASNQSCRDDCN